MVNAQGLDSSTPSVELKPDGNLEYSFDSKGNRIPDFSYSGYMAGNVPIPNVPIRIVVPLIEGDATDHIQSALDYVATLSTDKNGIRGAVLLKKGQYDISGSLEINRSGVILRGSGMDEEGTILIGKGMERHTLVRISGSDDKIYFNEQAITDNYVPINAMSFRVENSDAFSQGDNVLIRRPATQSWINEIGMTEFGGETEWIGWNAGERDKIWNRTITSVKEDVISIDAPLTTSLDSSFGGGKIMKFEWPGRIKHTGVEHIRLMSSYNENNHKDESHRWMAITMENVRDSWVRQVTFKHFAGSAVATLESSSRITVEDCISLEPISEIGAHRRNTYWSSGQQILFQRVYAENGYHDFSVGYHASLTVFVQASSYKPYNFSGTTDSWASGILFDIVNIDGGAIRLKNRMQEAQGAGWTAANSVIWQSSASIIESFQPPGAYNWVFGAWAEPSGDAYWVDTNNHIQPRSLYYAQLKNRIGEEVFDRAHLLPVDIGSYTSPTRTIAAKQTELAETSPVHLTEWISKAYERDPIPTDHTDLKTISDIKKIGIDTIDGVSFADSMRIKNGWLVRGNNILTGNHHKLRYWRGDVRPYAASRAEPHITRFVPGHDSRGLTDPLSMVTEWMKKNYIVALEHNHGLWYDRRRDDHQRVRRMDGNVWAPFFEMPFARSGKGKAWDGLSKYDLFTYNPWYWSRLGEFADIVDKEGLVFINQHYFQHNILEAGAHWSDFPWRPSNNNNNTRYTEPPYYAGDKRIFMSRQFYDITDSVHRSIHKSYIEQSLNNFTTNNGVIHLIGAEFTGPLHFAEFWLEIIKNWKESTGKHAFIGLSTTKDVQDQILSNPAYSEIIDLIDIRYWHYRSDGSLYAPKGGEYLAPRQHARINDPGESSFELVYRAVREYKDRYPDKAVMFSVDENVDQWAVFMAGGSLAGIPEVTDSAFLESAAMMAPINMPDNDDIWALSNGEQDLIIYNQGNNSISLNCKCTDGEFGIRWIQPNDGKIIKSKTVTRNELENIEKLHPDQTEVIWVFRR